MMSDHNSSNLAPQRQEITLKMVSSRPQKTDSSQQGLEFLFSPLLEEYYNPTHGLAEENNNDQAPNASFHQDDFSILLYMDHPFRTSSWKSKRKRPVQTRRQLPQILKCVCSRATVEYVEDRRTLRRAMANSAWIEAMQEELSSFDDFLCPTARSTQVLFQSLSLTKNAFLNGPLKEEFTWLKKPIRVLDPIIQKKSTFLRKAVWIKASFQEPETTALQCPSARQSNMTLSASLCSSNVYEDTASRLRLQLQQR
ncbi:hypothetical protein Tco_1376628 [Tanacetum coccineum]